MPSNKEKKKLQNKKYREENKEYFENYRKQNAEKFAEYRKAWKLKNRSKIRTEKYDLTPEEFESLEQQQQSKCKICETDCSLVIDHCHSTNKVRGLLCNSCNIALGFMKDNPNTLIKAAEYLKSTSA
jgi:hypothetical protein